MSAQQWLLDQSGRAESTEGSRMSPLVPMVSSSLYKIRVKMCSFEFEEPA